MDYFSGTGSRNLADLDAQWAVTPFIIIIIIIIIIIEFWEFSLAVFFCHCFRLFYKYNILFVENV